MKIYDVFNKIYVFNKSSNCYYPFSLKSVFISDTDTIWQANRNEKNSHFSEVKINWSITH